MKIQNLGQLFLLGLGLVGLSSGCTIHPPLQKVNSLGKVTVGQMLPGYSGLSTSGRTVGPVPSRGKFLINLLHPELPSFCVDEECGEIGVLAQKYGGQLQGTSDLKMGDIFGVLPPPDSSKNINEYGVLVISNTKGRVISIYNHARPDSVHKVLEDLQKP